LISSLKEWKPEDAKNEAVAFFASKNFRHNDIHMRYVALLPTWEGTNYNGVTPVFIDLASVSPLAVPDVTLNCVS